MQYRKFGKLDWPVSALGFGCMRLPTKKNASGKESIDMPEATRMVRFAIDNGLNYLDSAYVYHNGESETFIGQALQDGYRDKVHIGTKLPMFNMTRADQFDEMLNTQLKRLQTDHIDCYLFHGLDSEAWNQKVLPWNLLAKAEAFQREGKIRHLGFSFHGPVEDLIEIIDGYPKWDFCQIQYNYMDIDYQAGTRGLRYAAERGLAVIVMEPLLGGKLASPPSDIAAIMSAADASRSPADWALQWVWDQPEVSLVLSGMSTMEQVEQNLAAADKSRIGLFVKHDQDVIATARSLFQGRKAVPCTACGYCMPCPNGVDIPGNFRTYNEGIIYDRMSDARRQYARFVANDEKASQCIQCRICEDKCPQKILISEWMPKVAAELG
jgi:uncharacterized protein